VWCSSPPSCQRLSARVLEREQDSVSLPLSILSGSWVSRHCTVLPGPLFVLHKFSFLPNPGNVTAVHAVVHHYADPACSQPAVSFSMQGALHGDRISWSVAAGRVVTVRHSAGSAELPAGLALGGLQVLRLYQGRGLGGHSRQRLLVRREEGEEIMQQELVRYNEVCNLDLKLLSIIKLVIKGVQ
jgi:hypothetical protein